MKRIPSVLAAFALAAGCLFAAQNLFAGETGKPACACPGGSCTCTASGEACHCPKNADAPKEGATAAGKEACAQNNGAHCAVGQGKGQAACAQGDMKGHDMSSCKDGNCDMAAGKGCCCDQGACSGDDKSDKK